MSTKKKSIKGTKTEANLVAAYMSESAAYSRYTYYASQAEKEKYFPIAEVFTETAANELRHGKVFFKFLEGGSVGCKLNVDAGVIGDTASNLATAAHEEMVEGVEQYRNAAKVAEKEGFAEIAEHFNAIADIEEHHRQRFEAYLKQVKEGTVWKRDEPIKWQCMVCGYIYEGTEPSMECPAYHHPHCHYKAIAVE